jgi:hypothetical protein
MTKISKLKSLLLIGGIMLLGIGIGVYLLLIFGIITMTPSEAPISLMEGLTAFDTAIGAILSAGLLILYLQQKEILDDQRKLHRYELEGDLRIEDVGYNEDFLVVTLSNYTRSHLSDITLCTEIFPDEETNSTTFSLGRVGMERTESSAAGYNRTNALGPEQRGVKFQAKPNVEEKEGDNNPMKHDLVFLVHRLRDKYGVTEFGCRMWVEATDQINEKTQDCVFRFDQQVILERVGDSPDLRELFEGSATANIQEAESQFEADQ